MHCCTSPSIGASEALLSLRLAFMLLKGSLFSDHPILPAKLST
jgi:hypothetical protein